MNRPTQFDMHCCSDESSFPPAFSNERPSLVMHFLKQEDVRVWISAARFSLQLLFVLGFKETVVNIEISKL